MLMDTRYLVSVVAFSFPACHLQHWLLSSIHWWLFRALQVNVLKGQHVLHKPFMLWCPSSSEV